MASKSKAVVFDKNPGRNAQTYGIARQLNTCLLYTSPSPRDRG